MVGVAKKQDNHTSTCLYCPSAKERGWGRRQGRFSSLSRPEEFWLSTMLARWSNTLPVEKLSGPSPGVFQLAASCQSSLKEVRLARDEGHDGRGSSEVGEPRSSHCLPETAVFCKSHR